MGAPDEKSRCSIECMGDTSTVLAQMLKDMWSVCDGAKAFKVLSNPDVQVSGAVCGFAPSAPHQTPSDPIIDPTV